MDDSALIPNFSDHFDDLEPFDFEEGNGDGDSEQQSIPDEDLYDAINDETFGAEISTLTANDLADFAARTAKLALFDDEPTSSMEAPDPSQIPIPNIGNINHNLQFNDRQKDAKNRATENSFSSASQVHSSIWDSGSFNGIGSLSELYLGHQLKSESNSHHPEHQNIGTDRLPSFPSFIGPPPGLDLIKPLASKQASKAADGPLSVEELERKLLEEASIIRNSRQLTHIDSAELERKMYEDALAAQQQAAVIAQQIRQQKEAIQGMMTAAPSNQAMTTITSPALIPAAITPQPPQLPPGIVPPYQHQPSAIHGQPPQLPTGMPYPPPPAFFQFWQQKMQQLFETAASAGLPPPMPPPFFLPPPAGIAQQPMIHPLALFQCRDASTTPGGIVAQMASTPLPPHMAPPHPHCLPMPPLPPPPNVGTGHQSPTILPQLNMVPASLHPRVEKQRRQKANFALPSGKTISDYALDPYAGLMSTKEREWLIKIHIIQCLGTGDPMEDDYYYTVWKQKNILSKAPNDGKTNENPKYYKFEATFPATGYIAPSFMGALGKPVHSSSRIPRQIIEVVNENPEEELVSGKQTAANRQKRLRTVLMRIENAALLLIDCRGIRRKLRFFEDTCITEYIDKNEISDRIARFSENLTQIESSIFAPDQLPTVMLIQKGRQLVYEWLHFMKSEDHHSHDKMLTLMLRLLEGMNRFARRVPDDSLEAFSEGFCSLFMEISSQRELFSLLQAVNFEPMLIQDSKLVQFTLLTLLCALIRNSKSTGTLFSFKHLQATSIYDVLFTIPFLALKFQPDNNEDLQLFTANQWSLLHDWLLEVRAKRGVFEESTVAGRICHLYD